MRTKLFFREIGMSADQEAWIVLAKRGDGGANAKKLRAWAGAEGFDWLNLHLFLPNFPEPGRALVKNIGYSQINAIG